jgi:hypothetical protein
MFTGMNCGKEEPDFHFFKEKVERLPMKKENKKIKHIKPRQVTIFKFEQVELREVASVIAQFILKKTKERRIHLHTVQLKRH